MPAQRAPFSVGLIGYGLAGSVFHAPFITATPGLRLAAIVTRDPGRRATAHERYPDAELIDTPEELFARRPALDLIVVASPNGTHATYAEAALASGSHVVVDKPFATSSAQARHVVDLAHQTRRLAIPFHNRRWDGDFLTLRALIASGSLGSVYRLESRFERWRPHPKPRWTEPDALANAEDITYDLATHLIDQALVLFGPVRNVHAELDRRHPDVRGSDDAYLSLSHESGVRSRLWVSSNAAQSGPRFAVYGSKAAFMKYGLDPQEEILRGGGRITDPGFGDEPPERWGTLGTEGDARPVPTQHSTYRPFYQGVADAIAGNAPPPVDAEDAIAGLAIIEQARRQTQQAG